MKCPLCGSEKLKEFSITTREAVDGRLMRLKKCAKCDVIFAEDYASDRSNVYGDDYAAWNDSSGKVSSEQIAMAKKNAFKAQLKNIMTLAEIRGKKVLDVGAGGGYLLECLREAGGDCFGIEISSAAAEKLEQKFPGRIREGEIAEAGFAADFFDVIFMTDVLEHLADPKRSLIEIARVLKPGGYLFIISPDSDSWTRKFLGQNWFQYKYEHVFYFNRKSLSRLLRSLGFDEIMFKLNRKKFSLYYYFAYFEKYSLPGIGAFFRLIFPRLPERVKSWSFSNPITGEFLAIYQKQK
jgi:2-polyprenyl-3-methyl-5-hydroxy-6-metoxy-1,4-benzoquinol methylase